jgi:transcription termination/antitermination protein NusG
MTMTETASETAARMLTVIRRRDAARQQRNASTLTDVRWYVTQRFGRSDKAILDLFEDYKIETYYPRILTLKPIPRRQMSAQQRKSSVSVCRPMPTPLFPGYIFMHVDIRDGRVHEVFERGHVGGLVCHGGLPVWMPDDVINSIKARQNVDGCVPGKETMRAVFNVGDHVRVTEGPFASFPGIVELGLDVAIEEFDPETRIKVAVNIFGRPTPVELEIWQVAKL